MEAHEDRDMTKAYVRPYLWLHTVRLFILTANTTTHICVGDFHFYQKNISTWHLYFYSVNFFGYTTLR